MKVTRSCYYLYAGRQTFRKSICAAAVKECFFENRRRLRFTAHRGEFESRTRERCRRLCGGWVCEQFSRVRLIRRTTDSKHGLPVCANLLQKGANALKGKGAVKACDITYLRLADGSFCYLACLQDKFTRRVVGWKVGTRMTAQLVIDVFQQARRRGLIGKNAIIHTDQGSQYAALEYRRLLFINGFRQSMSRKGNCYDNAQAESFFSRLKAELVENGIFAAVADARSEVFSYIEGYDNRIRLHSGLNYQSPLEFEKQLKLENKIRSSESVVS